MTSPVARTPDGKPEPNTPEAASEKAELQVILLPTKEIPTTAGTGISVPGGQSGGLPGTVGRMGQLALTVILVIGTLFGASSARLGPVLTTVVILAELTTVLGVVFYRRNQSRS